MKTRDHFEKWFKGDSTVELHRSGDGYKYQVAHQAWTTWQASAKHYEAEIEQLQADKAKLIELLTIICKGYDYTLDEEFSNAVNDASELLTQMKAREVKP